MQLGERNWREVGDLTEKVVVVPLGSLEQHGHHLPLLTDSLIGAEIARRAHTELGDEAVFLPMLWIGASDHHRGFPGTVSLTTETYTHVLIELMDSLIGGGFRRIFLLNAHAGNTSPARLAINEVHLRYRREIPDLWLTFASWFEIAREQAAAVPSVRQHKVIHACEWETSMVETVRPDLVAPTDARPAVRRDDFPSAFYSADHRGTLRVDVARAMDESSPSGAFGYPELASAEKGEALYTAATREVVAFVREFARWPQTLSGSLENPNE